MMYAVLLCTALFTPAQPPAATPPAGAADRTTAGDRTATGAAGNVSLDGNWTVVSLERNGQPVPNAANMTVTVRGNLVTFDAAKATGGAGAGTGADRSGGAGAGAAGNANQMRAMRLDFGRNGQLYVTEAGADGKFDAGGAGGTGTGGAGGKSGAGSGGAGSGGTGGTTGSGTGGSGTGSGTSGTGTGGTGSGTTGSGSGSKFPTPPAGSAAGIPTGSKSGVYVLTQDFFAVSIYDESGGTGSPGSGTGTGGGADRQPLSTQRPSATDVPVPVRPASDRAGTDTGRAGTGGTQPRAPGDRAADRASAAGGQMPQTRTYVTVVLRRAGGAGGGNTRPSQDR